MATALHYKDGPCCISESERTVRLQSDQDLPRPLKESLNTYIEYHQRAHNVETTSIQR